MNLKALLFIVLTGFCFGTSLVGSRFGIQQFDTAVFIALRIATAAVAFLLIYLTSPNHRLPTERATWRHGLVLAIFSTAIPIYTFVFALNYISSGVTSLINASNPALTVTLAHFFLQNEPLSWRKGVGVALALSGASVLALRGETGLGLTAVNPIGYILVFIGIISVSSSTIYARRFAQQADPFDLAGTQLILTASAILPLTLIFNGISFEGVDWTGYLAVLYGGLIGTVSSFLLYFQTIKQFGATAASMMTYVIPIAAALGGVALLGERITLPMLIAMTIIFSGISIINFGGRRRLAANSER